MTAKRPRTMMNWPQRPEDDPIGSYKSSVNPPFSNTTGDKGFIEDSTAYNISKEDTWSIPFIMGKSELKAGADFGLTYDGHAYKGNGGCYNLLHHPDKAAAMKGSVIGDGEFDNSADKNFGGTDKMWYTNKPWDHKCESNDSPQKYFAFWRGANIKASGKLKDPSGFWDKHSYRHAAVCGISQNVVEEFEGKAGQKDNFHTAFFGLGFVKPGADKVHFAEIIASTGKSLGDKNGKHHASESIGFVNRHSGWISQYRGTEKGRDYGCPFYARGYKVHSKTDDRGYSTGKDYASFWWGYITPEALKKIQNENWAFAGILFCGVHHTEGNARTFLWEHTEFDNKLLFATGYGKFPHDEQYKDIMSKSLMLMPERAGQKTRLGSDHSSKDSKSRAYPLYY